MTSEPSQGTEIEVGENELDILSMLIGDDEEKWRNTRGQLDLVNQCIQKGETPKEILKNHFKVNVNHLSDDALEHWSIILHLIMEGSQRKRIESINTYKQACDLIRDSRNIVVLTGAGISVPCGVPDFRSRNGIYARLAVDFPDLDEPQSMFDIHYFARNPKPFFKFAKEIYPGKFSPSLGHRFIKLLEEKGKLLRNYTQNIDTLEQVAGISRIIHCHGSFASATCMRCEHRVDGAAIERDVIDQRIPICTACTKEEDRTDERLLEMMANATTTAATSDKSSSSVDDRTSLPIMKPDVVFFGEGLPKDFHSTLAEDKDRVDLLIVIGSSLKVRPVAHIPGCFPAHVPQILINKETLPSHSFDIELLGDCDKIVTDICAQLGWPGFLGNANADSGFSERSIFDLRDEIDAIIARDTERDATDATETNDGTVEPTVRDDKFHLLNVSDLLSDDITCVRVQPNKYIFKGAEFLINTEDLNNPDSQFAAITNQYDSSSYSSSSSDEEDDNSESEGDGQNSDQLKDEPAKDTQESSIDSDKDRQVSDNKSFGDSSPEQKRQRLSDSKNKEL